MTDKEDKKHNTVLLHKSFVYRLYPTPSQENTLDFTLAVCRDVYNSLVHWRKADYEATGKAPNYYQQKKALPHWKQTHPELTAIHSQILQQVVKRVDLAFQAFFRRIKAGETPGYPRRKGLGQYNSFTFTQSGYSVFENSLALSKIGKVKIVLHRALEGTVKTLTLRKRGSKWFACFTCEVGPKALPVSNDSIGVDVGLTHFATLSDGTTIENPRFFRKDEKALAKAGRKFDRVKNNHRRQERRKARKVVSRIHERIRNRRHNFVHQFARSLVNRFGVIAVEKLCVDPLMARPKPKPDLENAGKFLSNGASQKSGLNKSIADASWSMFRSVLTTKAESAGRQNREVVEVNPAYTSQDCSECGYRVRKALSDRVHRCGNCGLVLDRDHNAARNILQIAVGLHSVGTFTLV